MSIRRGSEQEIFRIDDRGLFRTARCVTKVGGDVGWTMGWTVGDVDRGNCPKKQQTQAPVVSEYPQDVLKKLKKDQIFKAPP